MPSFGWDGVEETNGVRTREWRLGANGRDVFGVLYEPVAGADPHVPMVLFGHGASGDRHQAPIPHSARRLVREGGFRALAIDGPVHGRRTQGDGGRGAFFAEWRREQTVADMLADWQAGLSAVCADRALAPRRLGYFGLSMGTIYGAPLVAAQPGMAAAVLGLMGVAGPTAHYQALVQAAAGAIHCPVLFLLQLEDELFTREQSLALFDAFGSDNKRLHAHPGLHAEVPAEEVAASVEFLLQHLAD